METTMTDDPSDAAGLAAQLMREALVRALQRQDGDEGVSKLQRIADALVDRAAGGDMHAIKEVNDRIDGRALPGVARSEPQQQTRRLVWLDYPRTIPSPKSKSATDPATSSSPSTSATGASPAS
jgi:hypothetical protein